MSAQSKYMYCLIGCATPKKFGPIGIGGRSDEVYTVSYKNLSAVLSDSPASEYRVTRQNTMAHQNVTAVVMKEHPVLPIRFCTIAESEEEIIEKVLAPRCGEFQDLLTWIGDKQELGLKVYWRDWKAVLKEIVEENADIKAMKEQIAAKPPKQTYYEQIEIGKAIEAALNAKREKEKEALLSSLKALSEDSKVHATYVPEQVLSAAFLVKKTVEPAFDKAVNEMAEVGGHDRHKITYVGDAPPVNFVNIVITWERWGREAKSCSY